MKLEIFGSYGQISDRAARKIAKALRHSGHGAPRLALLAAAGNSPIGTYQSLVALGKRLANTDDAIDTSAMLVFALDDYWGINNGDDRSFGNQLRTHLVQPLGLRDDQFIRFDLDVSAAEAIGKYDDAVARLGSGGRVGRFDLSVLGLGVNGHVGFNEPEENVSGEAGRKPSAEALKTRIVTLSPETREYNARYFGGDISRVPTQGITCGLGHLIAARQTMLLVPGAEKHPALRMAYLDGSQRAVPASHLIQASDVSIFADLQAWPHTAIPRQTEARR